MQTLINCFKEFRRYKIVRTETSTKVSSDVKPKYPGSTLPAMVIPDGEDATSFARHNKIIKMEYAKREKKNNMVIRDLVKQSFAMRRQDITKNPSHAQVILEKYPFLKDPDQVTILLSFHCT